MAKPFRGVINVDVTQSVPDREPYPQPVAPEGTPHVLYIAGDQRVGEEPAGQGRIRTQPAEVRMAFMRD